MPMRDPVQMAKDNGHNPVYDPGLRERWTCKDCGAAIVRYAGSIYGSAIEVSCDVQKAKNIEFNRKHSR